MTDPFFTPVSGFELPRFAGVPTFMRLPYVPPDHDRFSDVAIVVEFVGMELYISRAKRQKTPFRRLKWDRTVE